MINKILLVGMAGVVLGGCNLVTLTGKEAATDEQPKIEVAASVAPQTDAELETIPSPATDNDVESLEKDINDTQILDEDFSDLE
ncbi:MAG: hypothetical protein V1487_01055 [bacterium]